MPSFKSPLDHLANHNCKRCPLHLTTDRVCVMGDGSIDQRIMIVGEAPGASEERTGRVFSGQAGQLLDVQLAEAGIPRETVYVTNVAKCRPPDNRNPDRGEIEACGVYLQREIEAVRPTHLLILGNPALKTIARKSGITRHRGVRLEIRDPVFRGIECMATIHPAFVLRNPGQHSVLSEDIKRFARMVRGEFSVVETRGTLIKSVAGLKQLLSILDEAEVISYDVENLYRPWEDEWAIVCLGLTIDGERGYVVPLYHPESPFRQRWKDVLRLFAKPLNRSGVKLIAQNGKHDNVQLAGAGVFLEHTFDIMLAAHLLDENRPKNLGFLSQTMLGADVYKGQLELKPDKILKQDLRELALYNAHDTCYTHQIYPKLKEELAQHPRLVRLMAKLLMPASHVIQRVEYRGMYVDADRLITRIEQLQDHIDQQKEVLYDHLPSHWRDDFNFNSTQQLGRWLFSSEGKGGLGLDPLESTRTGRPSTREAVLLHYKGHPAISALLRYRTLQLKWMNTYLAPWADKIDALSRLHTTYKLYGTVTGRLSGDLQQVPRAPFIRSVIGAPEGWKFIQADYSQIELRIAAHMANEKRMKRAFLTGEDIHTLMASMVTGKPQEEITSEERKLAKAVDFGFLYGMGAWKFSTYAFESFDLNVSVDEAERFRNTYFEMFPDLRQWHRRQERVVKAQHHVQSPIGRVRHLPDVLSTDRLVQQEAVRQAINSPVQSMASDLMLFSMVKLADELVENDCFMVGTLHDAIFFECRESEVEEYSHVIKQTMENLPLKKTFGTELSVPVEADISVGDHWGEWV